MAKKKTRTKRVRRAPTAETPHAEKQAVSLPSPSQVISAFEQASRTQKALMIAGGLVVVGTSPYWVPAVWRSKRARSFLAAGAGEAFLRWFG